MIINHQDNIGAFAGSHMFYWPTNPLLFQRIGQGEAVEEAPAVAGQPFHLREGRYLPDFISIRQL